MIQLEIRIPAISGLLIILNIFLPFNQQHITQLCSLDFHTFAANRKPNLLKHY